MIKTICIGLVVVVLIWLGSIAPRAAKDLYSSISFPPLDGCQDCLKVIPYTKHGSRMMVMQPGQKMNDGVLVATSTFEYAGFQFHYEEDKHPGDWMK